MAKNILIVSSDFTGHGHKSITDSLKEQFEKQSNVSVHVIDGFSLAGNAGLRFGKFYGSVTRNARDLWKLMWEISLKRPNLICEFTELSIRENFINLIRNLKPDLILSVHPNFNCSLLNILEEYNIKIPFVTLIADLVSITPLWTDPRVDYLLCPTVEARDKSIAFGIPEEKIKIFGFPVRQKFCDHPQYEFGTISYNEGKALNCLIMSGGEGSGNMRRIATILLKNFNVNITIVTGRNKILKRRLELTLAEKYPKHVAIYGFVDNIQDFMHASDLIFLRGSPNSMLEAVQCTTPMIITGALPGQEEGNPSYAEKYNLGVSCRESQNLKKVVSDLLDNNAQKLNGIRHSQWKFRNPDAAAKIVQFLVEINKEVDYTPLPEIRKQRKLRLKSNMLL